MKKTSICALLLSATGCVYNPTGSESDGTKIINIPGECNEVLSIVKAYGPLWNLTCKNADGKEVFYLGEDDGWVKYKVKRN